VSSSPRTARASSNDGSDLLTLILWLLLLVICWPLALLALILYPIVWLILLPLRLLGIAVDGILQTLSANITLPARVLRGRRKPSP
jgi:hypothetical protein